MSFAHHRYLLDLSYPCQHNALAYPDLNTPFVLHVDASVEAISATISQEDRAGELRLVTCTSRKLNPAERNYHTHEREMLAIVHAIKKWNHYLLGAKIRAYTDNVALKFWRTAQNLSPRQVRWQAYISMFDVEIAHIPGVTNTAADAISRLECRIADTSSWEAAYREDPRFQASFQDGHPSQFRHGRLWKDDRIEVPR